jgi:hypothetical protein
VIRTSLPARRLLLLALVAMTAGAIAAVAQAAGGGSATVPAAAPAVALAQNTLPVPGAMCRPRERNAPRTPPSNALKNAFAILRSEPDADDALPAKALAALKGRGLDPVDPASARLLRADGDQRAWVVPVPDVNVADPIACARLSAPREGLAVVAANGAPAGGGGALGDLRRGLAAPTIDTCAGAARDMLGVSGIVPDGVEAVFVTAADGTATRADVRANGYAFVLPRPRRPERRYVVWTAPDGTPHVQPLPPILAGPRDRACPAVEVPPRVTPDPWSFAGCNAVPALPMFVPPRIFRAPRPARPRAPRPSILPAPIYGGCPSNAVVIPSPGRLPTPSAIPLPLPRPVPARPVPVPARPVPVAPRPVPVAPRAVPAPARPAPTPATPRTP